MTADTLTADGAAVTLGVFPQGDPGPAFIPVGYTVSPDQDHIYVLTMQPNDASSPAAGGQQLWLETYTTSGTAISGSVVGNVFFASILSPEITTLGDGHVAVAWQVRNGSGGGQVYYADGQIPTPVGSASPYDFQGPPDLFATIGGFALEWAAQSTIGNPPAYATELQTVDANGHEVSRTTTPSATPVSNDFGAHAFAAANGAYLQIIGNTLEYYENGVLSAPATIPDEGNGFGPITDEAAALLTDGQAAVAWNQAGKEYLSLYDPTVNSLSTPVAFAGGPLTDLHILALPDGGFATSWVDGGAYKGEVFDAAGHGGGIINLAGDVAGIDSHGDLYTVAETATSTVVQAYAISGGSSGGGGATTGQTFTSDNNGDHWIGTAGNDTFNLGRGGDVVTGNGGDDTYNFAGVPWAGGHITDFNAGDVLDLTGLMSTTSDKGADGFADGYLKITDDGTGNAQVWADYHVEGNDGWWLVETLDGVAPGNLTHDGDKISVGSSSGGGGGGAGQTFTSNDNGKVLVGTAGDDTFHLGRGGDTVTGGAGADTFAYAAIPWAGGAITDFNAAEGDKIDVSGLLSQASFTGSDPFADGYLKFAADSSGNAQVWADYNLPGNDGWWLVATLDGVSTSSLHYSGGLIT